MRTGVTAWSSVGLRESTYSAGPAYCTEQRSSAAQRSSRAQRGAPPTCRLHSCAVMPRSITTSLSTTNSSVQRLPPPPPPPPADTAAGGGDGGAPPPPALPTPLRVAVLLLLLPPPLPLPWPSSAPPAPPLPLVVRSADEALPRMMRHCRAQRRGCRWGKGQGLSAERSASWRDNS